MKPSLQITQTGIRIANPKKIIQCLRREFEKSHYVHLKHFLEPSFLKQITRKIDPAINSRVGAPYVKGGVEKASFYERAHKGIALESCMNRNAALNILEFAVNDQNLFDIIQQITGCGTIGCFNGRVYRMRPGRGHYDSWHSDINKREGRMVGMSVNLSTRFYKGGILQIRNKKSKKALCEISNTGSGDAILFHLAPFLEHQVTDVEGHTSKTAFAGWFQAFPKFQARLERKLSPPYQGGVRGGQYRFTFSKEIVSHKLGSTLMLCNPSTNVYYGLDHVGQSIWDLVERKKNLQSIVDGLSKRYDASPELLKEDATNFLQVLLSTGLIR